MKKEKRWIIAFIIITVVAFTGVFWKHQSADDTDVFNTIETINYGDVARLMTATSLVLLMTPG